MAFSMSHGLLERNATPLRYVAQQAKSLEGRLKEWSLAAAAEIYDPTSLMYIEAWSMYHTASLYLHNAFDVEGIWIDLEIDTPQLSSEDIQIHVAKLLLIIDKALTSTNICPMLFLMHLYVAASCTKFEHERNKIISLLTAIAQMYEIANACLKQLSTFWMFEDLFEQANCPAPVFKHHQRLFLGHLREERKCKSL